MKKLLLLFLFAVFCRCAVVYFEEPQPKGAKALTTVPKELRGNWFDKTDTVYISEKGRLDISAYTDNLKKTTIKKEINYLSDSLILKKAGKFYVVNARDVVGWTVMILKKEKNGDLSWYVPLNYPYFIERRHLKANKVVFSGGGDHRGDSIECKSLKDIKNLDTSNIIEVHYKGKLKTRDIKKIIVSKNLLCTYKKDGTLLYPKESSDTIQFNIEIPIKE